MNGKRGALFGSFLFIYVAPLATAEPAMLRAVQSLDEPRGYCLDISGSGPTVIVWADPHRAQECSVELSNRFPDVEVLWLSTSAKGAEVVT